MKTLEEEAEEYASIIDAEFYKGTELTTKDLQNFAKIDFIAGATSKWVKIEKIECQLELLRNFYYGEDLKDDDVLDFYKTVYNSVKSELEQQLKELENEKK